MPTPRKAPPYKGPSDDIDLYNDTCVVLDSLQGNYGCACGTHHSMLWVEITISDNDTGQSISFPAAAMREMNDAGKILFINEQVTLLDVLVKMAEDNPLPTP